MPSARLQVLLIADSTRQIDVERRTACDPSCTYFSCHDAAAASETLTRHSIDAVVIATEGLAQTIRAVQVMQQQHPQVPQIAICTAGELADSERGVDRLLSAGAQDVLTWERCGPESVREALQKAVARQRSFGQLHGVLAQFRDRSQKLEREVAQLTDLCRQAQRFVDDVSHEFRTPLSIIKEYTALVQEGFAGQISDQQQRMLGIVEDRADELNHIVDDLLDVSRLESGQLGVQRRATDLPTIVESVVGSLRRKAELKGVQLTVSMATGLPDVFCDSEKVARAIANLAVNGIKYCGNPGRVEICATRGSGPHWVRVSVTDNGPGIAPERRAAIFQRFVREADGPSPGRDGFGLGLSIAKELVELNLGQLQIDGETGGGSTFSFEIPVADPEQIARLLLTKQATETPVSLYSVRCAATASPAAREGVEQLIGCRARNRDLVFRKGHSGWLVVLVEDDAADDFAARTARWLAEANRNRPDGPLPELECQRLGQWTAKDAEEVCLELQKQLYDHGRAAPHKERLPRGVTAATAN